MIFKIDMSSSLCYKIQFLLRFIKKDEANLEKNKLEKIDIKKLLQN